MAKNIKSPFWKGIQAMLLFWITMVLSCQKDQTTSSDIKNSSITVVKKEFFRQDLQSKLTTQFSDSLTINWSPSWNNATEKVVDSLLFTYVPLEQTTKVKLHNQQNYLIAQKRDSLISFYLGTYITNPDSSDNKAVMNLESFTGGLLLENLKTGVRYFYNYKNGLPVNDSKLKGFSKKASTSSDFYCTYITVCNWGGACSGGAHATFTYSPASHIPGAYSCLVPVIYPCNEIIWYKVSSYVIQHCPTSTPPPPPPPPDPDPYGGTSGYGDQLGLYETNNQTSIPVDTNIRKIAYWCNNFTVPNRTAFVSNFYSVLNHGERQCYNKYIMLNLEKSHRGKMATCINENQLNPAEYNPDLHSMSFQSTFFIMSGFMDHEFFHAYQNIFYRNGTTQYSIGNQTGYSNIEFETQLYKDITAPGEFAQAFRGSPNLNAEYLPWLASLQTVHPTSFADFGTITINGTTMSKYFYFLEKWKSQWSPSTTAQPTYNTPINYQLMPDALLNVFINSSCP